MLAALATRRNRYRPTPGTRPGPQAALEFGARAPVSQPYRGATRRVGRLEIGSNDAAFRHIVQRAIIENGPTRIDDYGHGKVGGTHDRQHARSRQGRYTQAYADGGERLRSGEK